MSNQTPSKRVNFPKLPSKAEAQNQDAPESGEIDPATGKPTPIRRLECPPELPPRAREEWDRIVGELIALGVLSKFDLGPLAIYCGAFAMWSEAMDGLQKHGTMMKSPNGYPVQSPYVAVVNRQAETMMRIAGEFGFTPGSRSRNFNYNKSNSMLLEVKKEPGNELMPVTDEPHVDLKLRPNR